MTGGYVKLYRSIESWEWYTDSNTKSLFLHCLIRSNHKANKWRGTVIESGSFVTSLESLSEETGLTIREVRTSLKHLEKTNEILRKTTNRFTQIFVVKWGDYQGQDDDSDKQTTNKRQTNDKQTTTNKNDKKEKNEKNNTNIGVFSKYAADNLPLLKALEDFEAMRKDIKKPLSNRARQLLCNKLTELSSQGENIIDCLNESVLHNWQGVFAKKKDQRRVEPIPDYNEHIPGQYQKVESTLTDEEVAAFKERLKKFK